MPIRRVLLIDDDEDDQQLFTMAVEEVSPFIECNCIQSARLALLLLQSKKISPDLIFVDLNMPVMNGNDFLSFLKADSSLAHYRVIIFSTSSDPRMIEHCKELGAFDFITKPAGFRLLIEKLSLFLK